jgi:hypothetical protein
MNVSQWNEELLHVGGYLARVIYEYELSAISDKQNSTSQATTTETSISESELQNQVEAHYSHLINFLAFRPSTPSAKVSRILRSAFFGAADKICVLSTSGIMPSASVRVRSPEMENFIKTIPILPKTVQEGGAEFVKVLEYNLKIRPTGPDDIVREMERRVFEEDEMIESIKWIFNKTSSAPLHASFWERFVRVSKFKISQSGDEILSETQSTISLAKITSYVDPQGLVPHDGPFPSTALPLRFSRIEGLLPKTYSKIFGWSAFSIADWVVYLSSHVFAKMPYSQYGPSFCENMLSIAAREWPNMSSTDRDDITSSLSRVTCIPTHLGLQLPRNSYFRANHLFLDLPMVKLQDDTDGMETLLARLGVRKHIDLQILFGRKLIEGDWALSQLIRYLTGVMDEPGEEEKVWLQEKAFFFAEELPQGCTKPQANPLPGNKRSTWKISSLYEPTDEMRRLGLPILDWGIDPQWNTLSQEGKLISKSQICAHYSHMTFDIKLHFSFRSDSKTIQHSLGSFLS